MVVRGASSDRGARPKAGFALRFVRTPQRAIRKLGREACSTASHPLDVIKLLSLSNSMLAPVGGNQPDWLTGIQVGITERIGNGAL